MSKQYDELADALAELSTHYEAEGHGRKARQYQLAASELRYTEHMPPDPTDLPDVSRTVRDHIAEWRAFKEIDKLTELREKRPYLSELTRAKSVGPKTAEKIYNETGAETLEDLEEILESGEITDVHGIGSKTATTIRRSVAQLD
jgi:DNA polymerase IV (family X)